MRITQTQCKYSRQQITNITDQLATVRGELQELRNAGKDKQAQEQVLYELDKGMKDAYLGRVVFPNYRHKSLATPIISTDCRFNGEQQNNYAANHATHEDQILGRPCSSACCDAGQSSVLAVNAGKLALCCRKKLRRATATFLSLSTTGAIAIPILESMYVYQCLFRALEFA